MLFSSIAFSIHATETLAIKRNLSGYLGYLYKICRLVDLITKRNSYINCPYSVRQVNLKGFSLGFKRLQGCISDILCLHLGAIEHFVGPAVCCLSMVVSFCFINFLSIICSCGHIQDHSVVGRSAVRNAMACILVYLGVDNHHWFPIL